MPALSDHFESRAPSAIRQAQILFAQRSDQSDVQCINLAIGNVSLPMHPALQERMRNLGAPGSPFADGVVKYTPSVGTDEAQRAFINIIASTGFSTDGLSCVVTDGGSQSMELMVLGVCGPAASHPLLLLDPAYTNYMDMARRVAVPTVSIRRQLGDDGTFAPPSLADLEAAIRKHNPRGMIIIPTDNPTGQFIPQDDIAAMARLCVEHDMWLISDEAYRQLHYNDQPVSSIWGLSESDVPGITGRRISIESASKVWSACGLRVGALVTDNSHLQAKAVAEYTANLSANAIGQYIFGGLADLSHNELHQWYAKQRTYYSTMMRQVADGLRKELPGVIVSNPDAALYSVIDVRKIAPAEFDAATFVAACAERGRVAIDGVDHTLLVSPMGGFYGERMAQNDPSATQMRLAFVAPPEEMERVPRLFAALFAEYGTAG